MEVSRRKEKNLAFDVNRGGTGGVYVIQDKPEEENILDNFTHVWDIKKQNREWGNG